MSQPDSPARSSIPAIAPVRWVVYRDVGGLYIFASVEIAVHEHAIYAALMQSRTWGEFRRSLPEGEWPALEERLLDREADEDEEDRIGWEHDATPFNQDHVRGCEHSDYPHLRPEWLGDEDGFVNALIKAHNELLLTTPYRGIYWQIPLEWCDDVVDLLRHCGYFVEQTDFLKFC